MAISSSPGRTFLTGILIMLLLTSCGGSVLPPEPDSEVEATAPSGKAGTATIRIERHGEVTSMDWHWEVSAEFPITLYFDEGDDSPIFFSTGKGTAVMAATNVGADGNISHLTSISDVDFEVRGAFNAKDCSVELFVEEVWVEGADVTYEVGGVVINAQTDESVIFTEDGYQYKSLKFPLGVGQVTNKRKIGDVDWNSTFTITSLIVPEFTGCGSFDYQDESLDTSENGS